MPQVFFCIPGDLSLPTGGYAYDRKLLQHAGAQGIDLRHIELPAAFPSPSPRDLEETARLIAETPPDSMLLIDGLAFGAMPEALIHGSNRRIIALVHHPLGLETGLDEKRRAALIESEKAALALAERIIVTSPATARTLAQEFAAPRENLVVAEPGVDPRPRAAGSPPGAPLRLLAVGSVVARKGYDVLIAALAPLTEPAWTLSIVGAFDRSPEAFFALREQIRAGGLDARVELAGAAAEDELLRRFDGADLFVMASHYEGYGMVAAEALAHGLPIVSTTGGALAETVPGAAAIKVPPGDAVALGDALREAMLDAPLRKRLADASWAAGRKLPRWEETAARIADALKEMATSS